ncbi:hypothetical protein BPTFM16_01033 [Altererythrobacter insulae]|nr:hypothetical protein BPTFM16_01033 [Altererythrobacter insulae]
MSRFKKVVIGIVALIALAISGVIIAGVMEPSVDPDFRADLIAADDATSRQLIDSESRKLGVTALSVSIMTTDQPVRTEYFGRANPDGLMQVASLSKAVAAAVIAIHAENQGVGLDDDIRSQIKSLDIASLEGGDRPVTLRQLLSHTTGSSQSGYPGYPRDHEIPSTVDVIKDPPRWIESPLVFDGTPGEFRYSGGGYTIAQLWAEETSGKDFATLADELLLTPLQMDKSTFAQPINPDEIAPLTITGADVGFAPTEGVFRTLDNSWHNYPEQAAAGLWSTTEDYALFVSALLQSARGENSIIPVTVAEAMLAPIADPEWWPNGSYGLGVVVEINEDGALHRVAHSGANAGYRSFFLAQPQTADQPMRIVTVIGNMSSAAGLNREIAMGLLESEAD